MFGSPFERKCRPSRCRTRFLCDSICLLGLHTWDESAGATPIADAQYNVSSPPPHNPQGSPACLCQDPNGAQASTHDALSGAAQPEHLSVCVPRRCKALDELHARIDATNCKAEENRVIARQDTDQVFAGMSYRDHCSRRFVWGCGEACVCMCVCMYKTAVCINGRSARMNSGKWRGFGAFSDVVECRIAGVLMVNGIAPRAHFGPHRNRTGSLTVRIDDCMMSRSNHGPQVLRE